MLQEADANEFINNSTQLDIITRLYAIVKENSNSENYELELMKQKINEVQEKIIS